ncbi:MAG: hypothetical protein H6897_16460 [Rhodobacteraceae bacterium]|jgi:hypothetical protein|uniref:hypothetical protein n=1 Tax=Albidovulum sp. TaxID=1872424 RepID=UPI001E05E24E|nr:hypothetical protein [uncultured Defluviimonas sp.]MCB2125870.1 hypothetical protein [Paracoccaceae bacterium]MCC0071508.1 hypothetical protein [Paracoccaceae bacterium]
MSTWTSRAAALLPALALSACVAGMAPTGSAPRAVAVAGGAVTATGPAGYCVDRAASRGGAEGSFVLFGTCAALSGTPAPGQPAKPAVLTASVVPGAPDEATFAAAFPAMARFFGSDPGRAALSRSGKAGTVDVGAVSSRDAVIYLSLTDSAAGPGQAVAPDYWRAILALRGHLVTLSVMSLADRPLTSADKRRILDAFVARMRAANEGGAAG